MALLINSTDGSRANLEVGSSCGVIVVEDYNGLVEKFIDLQSWGWA
jgi:hypothetical protein